VIGVVYDVDVQLFQAVIASLSLVSFACLGAFQVSMWRCARFRWTIAVLMMFQNYTPCTLVYYHFKCITVTMFARMSDESGFRSFNVNLQDSLSPDDIAVIEGSIMDAKNAEPVMPAVKKRAKWEDKMWKAEKRRRRREAKAKAKGGLQMGEDQSGAEVRD
jgi:hypothetical protein